jgi:hypothetical protein
VNSLSFRKNLKPSKCPPHTTPEVNVSIIQSQSVSAWEWSWVAKISFVCSKQLEDNARLVFSGKLYSWVQFKSGRKWVLWPRVYKMLPWRREDLGMTGEYGKAWGLLGSFICSFIPWGNKYLESTCHMHKGHKNRIYKNNSTKRILFMKCCCGDRFDLSRQCSLVANEA